MDRVVKPAEAPEEDEVATDTVLWPAEGEEVLYNTGYCWKLAEVMMPAAEDGELNLLCSFNGDLVHQRATHGNHEHGWLTYAEAAVQLKRSPV